MIEIYVGLPGSGKSLRTAEIVMQLLRRNKKYYKRSGIVRQLYSNMRLNPSIEDEYKGFIKYWTDPSELVKVRDVDIVWDEVATYLDSTQWQNVPLELKRWLQQHRKFGIDIYGNTQDFPMIDISMRRLVHRAFLMKKLVGSRDKSATRPAPKRVWGLIIMREIDPASYTADKTEYRFVSSSFMFIKRSLCDVFDTTQEIKTGQYPPLRHIKRDCANDDCTFHKIIHV
jgi:hypothetical protein